MCIRFCGGCNSQIDRGKVAEALRSCLEREGVSVMYNVDHADYVVYMNGCYTCCALKYHPPSSNLYVVVAADTVDHEKVREVCIVETVLRKLRKFSGIGDFL
ncbi:MAG: hypothetical protein N2317_04125 [Syntrophales bacterium]|nr:hypothetical protein [Syntrophales bacterium]